MNKPHKPFNHPTMGGNVVDLKRPVSLTSIPQRKPNSAMSGEELLNKAVNGTKKK